MGKTVTTYLIDGDPKGTQYAFISNKICQMFVIPRSNLAYLNEQEKLHKPAFYILIGEDEATKPQAYIGETENFKERVKDHDSKKEFWYKALIFVSKDEDMTKADVQYLEHKAIAEAKKLIRLFSEKTSKHPRHRTYPNISEMLLMNFSRISSSWHRLSAVISSIWHIPRKSICFTRKLADATQKDFIIRPALRCLQGVWLPMIARRLSLGKKSGRRWSANMQPSIKVFGRWIPTRLFPAPAQLLCFV